VCRVHGIPSSLLKSLQRRVVWKAIQLAGPVDHLLLMRHKWVLANLPPARLWHLNSSHHIILLEGSDLVSKLQYLRVFRPRCARPHVVRDVLRLQALLIHLLRVHEEVVLFFRGEILLLVRDPSHGVCDGARVHQQVSFLRRAMLHGEVQAPKGLLWRVHEPGLLPYLVSLAILQSCLVDLLMIV